MVLQVVESRCSSFRTVTCLWDVVVVLSSLLRSRGFSARCSWLTFFNFGGPLLNFASLALLWIDSFSLSLSLLPRTFYPSRRGAWGDPLGPERTLQSGGGEGVFTPIDGRYAVLGYGAFADWTLFVVGMHMQPSVEAWPTEEMATACHHGFVRLLKANVALEILSYA